jgi:hypothetical protein
MPLYTSGMGIVVSGEMPLYALGHAVSSGIMPLYTKGHIQTSGNMPIYTIGHGQVTATMGLYTKGHVAMPLFTRGGGATGQGGVVTATMPLFAYNNQSSGATIIDCRMPLYCSGQPPIKIEAVMPLFIAKDIAKATAILPLFLNTTKRESTTATMPLFTKGALHSGVYGVEQAYMSLFTIGYYSRRRVIQPTYEVQTSGILPLYAIGS